jgi:hypothetical protein
MKLYLKSIATLFSIFLALCGMNQPVRAQSPTVVSPYYFAQTNEDTSTVAVVLRIRTDSSLTGTYIASSTNAITVYAITGNFNSSTNTLSGIVTYAPAFWDGKSVEYSLAGTYDPDGDRFAIQFTKAGEPSPEFIIEKIARWTSSWPLLVGIWQWQASSPNNLNLIFGGEFYIYLQQDKSEFYGIFSTATAQDIGFITGEAHPTTDQPFTFTRHNQKDTILQTWKGNVVNNNLTLQGTITHEKPLPAADYSFVAGAY